MAKKTAKDKGLKILDVTIPAKIELSRNEWEGLLQIALAQRAEANDRAYRLRRQLATDPSLDTARVIAARVSITEWEARGKSWGRLAAQIPKFTSRGDTK